MWTMNHSVQDLLFRIRSQIEARSNREKTPDVQGVVMADSSLTSTSVYKRLRAFTKLIHEFRDSSKGSEAVSSNGLIETAPLLPSAPINGSSRGRGSKRKAPVRSSVCLDCLTFRTKFTNNFLECLSGVLVSSRVQLSPRRLK